MIKEEISVLLIASSHFLSVRYDSVHQNGELMDVAVDHFITVESTNKWTEKCYLFFVKCIYTFTHVFIFPWQCLDTGNVKADATNTEHGLTTS